MAHDAAFPHLFQSLLNQRVLVGVQFDVIGDRLVDEIAARAFLLGGQRIKRFNLFSDGTETDGSLLAAHNARTITHITLYYSSIDTSLGGRDWQNKASVDRMFPKRVFRPGGLLPS